MSWRHLPARSRPRRRAAADHAAGAGRRRRRQRGFTLIEMLVVISILGILAAIVSLSVVGLTSLAQKRALDGELAEVQSATTFMIADQQAPPDQACSQFAGPTADMSRFPSTAAYKFGQPATHRPVALYPRYLRKQVLMRAYVCLANGDVEPAPTP